MQKVKTAIRGLSKKAYGVLSHVPSCRAMLASIQANVASRGEPLVRAFEPTALAARVKELGFMQVWDFGPEEADAQYFAGRTDGLRTPTHSHLMKARVGNVAP